MEKTGKSLEVPEVIAQRRKVLREEAEKAPPQTHSASHSDDSSGTGA